LAGSYASGGTYPVSASVDPTGRFLFVANRFTNNVSAHDVSHGDMRPVTGSPFAARGAPSSIATDPLGKFVYAVNYDDNSISAYDVNESTGGLTEMSGSPFAAEVGPAAIAIVGTTE
jgi:6-phosphogluconolactonase (cycloisomerase 2 family)